MENLVGLPVAVVTGASSGIGAATARLLAANGFRVVACARRTEKLDQLAATSPSIEANQLDVTSDSSVASLADYLKGQPVEILVNCAGGAFDFSTVLDSDPAIWSKTYEVNVVGSVRMVKALTPVMVAHGKGTIVVITSTAGYTAYENGGSYVSAKFGEVSLARTLRLELNGQRIRVVEIAPGMVATEEFSTVRFNGDSERAAKVYAGVAEPLTAEDVAESIRWSVMLPQHFNVDSLVIRPLAQAANHKVHRT